MATAVCSERGRQYVRTLDLSSAAPKFMTVINLTAAAAPNWSQAVSTCAWRSKLNIAPFPVTIRALALLRTLFAPSPLNFANLKIRPAASREFVVIIPAGVRRGVPDA
ncbi:hypothetical protein EVAR_84483_1 [Eumeta japonica]|uniref:Uncharacterized protein n=1 Tax=Eumeta variegata TaxID=151549 RepID=A0A4C1SGS3_EUMVA|nr:hypothetical protein EVAR_84483_1 [Eumeta japonica]